MSDVIPVIAAAGIEQASELAAVERAAFDDPWTADAIRTRLGDGLSRAWTASIGRDVVGAALVRIVAGEGELLRIAVAPSYRRRGVGRRLLAAVTTDVAAACPDGLHLEVRAANVAARRLYAAAGFVETGRRRAYYRAPPDDAILLCWTPIATLR